MEEFGKPPLVYSPPWIAKSFAAVRTHIEPPHPGYYLEIELNSDVGYRPLVTPDSPMIVAYARIIVDGEPTVSGAPLLFTTRLRLRNKQTGVVVMPGGLDWSLGQSGVIPGQEYFLVPRGSLGGAGRATLETGHTLLLEWDHLAPEVGGEDPPEETGAMIDKAWVQVCLESAKR